VRPGQGKRSASVHTEAPRGRSRIHPSVPMARAQNGTSRVSYLPRVCETFSTWGFRPWGRDLYSLGWRPFARAGTTPNRGATKSADHAERSHLRACNRRSRGRSRLSPTRTGISSSPGVGSYGRPGAIRTTVISEATTLDKIIPVAADYSLPGPGWVPRRYGLACGAARDEVCAERAVLRRLPGAR
jgi:hypothetical protein